jgi:hypothetical protein
MNLKKSPNISKTTVNGGRNALPLENSFSCGPELEAEKSTFGKELSFQRSESTTGLEQVTVFMC